MISLKEEKENLLACIETCCYSNLPKEKQLSSGKKSNEYIDLFFMFNDASNLESLSSLVHLNQDVDAVGGPAVGAIPFAISLTWRNSKTWFYLDKNKTPPIQGLSHGVRSVSIVDDVATTGNSIIHSIAECNKAGLLVKEVIVVVDREEGAKQRLEEIYPDVRFKSIFTLYDVRQKRRELNMYK